MASSCERDVEIRRDVETVYVRCRGSTTLTDLPRCGPYVTMTQRKMALGVGRVPCPASQVVKGSFGSSSWRLIWNFKLWCFYIVLWILKSGNLKQCDQMAILFFILSIFNNENMPNSIEKGPYWGQRFCKIISILSNSCQRLLKCCPPGEISPNLVTLILSMMMKAKNCTYDSGY